MSKKKFSRDFTSFNKKWSYVYFIPQKMFSSNLLIWALVFLKTENQKAKIYQRSFRTNFNSRTNQGFHFKPWRYCYSKRKIFCVERSQLPKIYNIFLIHNLFFIKIRHLQDSIKAISNLRILTIWKNFLKKQKHRWLHKSLDFIYKNVINKYFEYWFGHHLQS